MDRQLIRLLCILGTVVSIFFTTTIQANQCPNTPSQNKKGFWSSSEKPGWASRKPTKTNLTVNASNFTGAAYNPRIKQIACIYKTTNNNKTIWVLLFSNKKHLIHQDSLINMNQWVYKQKYKFYVCGKPQTKSNPADCQFKIH